MFTRYHSCSRNCSNFTHKFLPPLLLMSLLVGSLSFALWLSFYRPLLASPIHRPPAQKQAAQWSITPDRFLPGYDETWSIAWGDVDNDGDLDLVTGNDDEPLLLYRNQDGVVEEVPFWRSTLFHSARSIAWGDVNGDGYLDLAVGDFNRGLVVYRNLGGTLTDAPWTSVDINYIRSIAWGDVNGDGKLDLAAGISGTVKIFLNQGDILAPTPHISLGIFGQRSFTSVAWGDANNDGYLDLALGTSANNTIFFNDQNGELSGGPPWSYRELGNTRAVAWGDMDGDGQLDLAVGNVDSPSKVYRNLGNREFDTLHWRTNVNDRTSNIAWADVDGNGYLDLTIANAFLSGAEIQPIRIYRNLTGTLQISPTWEAPDVENTRAIAWGDMDGDGDVDLAAGRLGPDTIYRNRGSTMRPTIDWRSPMTDDTYSLAWGDVDSDGALDLAVGNGPERPNLLYHNRNQQLVNTNWAPLADRFTHGVAWGDADGDGDLDLAIGNSGFPQSQGAVNELYLNNGQGLDDRAAWSSDDQDSTLSVAWGDVDGDGDLDLAAANFQGPNKVYIYEDGSLTNSKTWSSADSDRTASVAWGDVDNDGDLDLAAANSGAPSKLYLNQQGVLDRVAAWYSTDVHDSQSVAWGDMNGDGYLDLAVGNAGQPTKVFLNVRGQLQTVATWFSADSFNARSVAWGDADGDGDLDLAIGNFGQPIKVYLNEGGFLSSVAAWSSNTSNTTRSVAWGDIDGDGDLDLAVGNRDNEVTNVSYTEIYLNQRAAYLGRSGPTVHPPSIAIHLTSDPVQTFSNRLSTALAPANFYATPAIRQGRVIPLTYSLFHPLSEPVAEVRAYYSLNGSFSGPRSTWQEAKATSTTQTTDLTTAPYPARTAANTHTFGWDLLASNFFGQSDNVVVRIEALPDYTPRPNSAPGFFQYPLVATQTFPFRVRGTQIRVVDPAGQPVSNALLYRLPADRPDQSHPIGNDQVTFRTMDDGYLQGRGELARNDRLLALKPIHATAYYTLYHTSGTPTESGVDSFVVTTGGVQTLTVSADNPLLLFDLIVSLEWEEGNNTPFLSTLRRDLLESSKALYDWSNGQIALGKITIYQGRDHWDEAHIQLLASNQVRPSANRGGIVTTPTILTDPRLTEPITATRGIVRIGPNWTRYGDSDPNFIHDWARVLAHELGHYLLFLEDSYLGLDEENGLLIPVDTCQHTAMTDPYEDEGSEFRYGQHGDGDYLLWQHECAHTLAELPDWELIRLVYPALHSPPPVNPGPGNMPFVFTTVQVMALPTTAAQRLVNPLITIGPAEPQLLNGRIYLQRPGQHLLDLGKYTGNEVLTRGAYEGDTLCIFGRDQYACSRLSNSQLASFPLKPLWASSIAVTPTSTRTLTIWVDSSAGPQVIATIYPDGATPQQVTFATGSPQPITLDRPAVEALVEVTSVDGSERFITGYALGSGPGRLRSFDGPGRLRSFDGPVSSSDGGAVLYPPLTMPKTTFIALQLATTLPDLPLGLVPLGRAYYVRPSTPITNYQGGSIAFQYLGRDVSQAYLPEEHLAVYHWDGATWTCVSCPQQVQNLEQNIVSSPLVGDGLYLLAGFQLSLKGAELNPIGYPLPYSLPVTQALAALEDFYTVIYHYDVNQSSQPWTAYGVNAPAWVNTLLELKPNQSYWLYVTETMRWSIVDAANHTTIGTALQPPPSIFYGVITPTATFTPSVDLPVSATVNNQLCGQSRTQLIDDQIVYVIVVGCGNMDQPVAFTVADRNLATTATWDNRRIQQFGLSLDNSSTGVIDPPLNHHLYLPLIANR